MYHYLDDAFMAGLPSVRIIHGNLALQSARSIGQADPGQELPPWNHTEGDYAVTVDTGLTAI